MSTMLDQFAIRSEFFFQEKYREIEQIKSKLKRKSIDDKIVTSINRFCLSTLKLKISNKEYTSIPTKPVVNPTLIHCVSLMKLETFFR